MSPRWRTTPALRAKWCGILVHGEERQSNNKLTLQYFTLDGRKGCDARNFQELCLKVLDLCWRQSRGSPHIMTHLNSWALGPRPSPTFRWSVCHRRHALMP